MELSGILESKSTACLRGHQDDKGNLHHNDDQSKNMGSTLTVDGQRNKLGR